uniref:Uncharacterized protein n=1 Tax=Ciona intestinalis TaxID=7719 RepID=H2Y1Z6_CIOIN
MVCCLQQLNMVSPAKRLLGSQRYECLKVLTQDALEATFGNLVT